MLVQNNITSFQNKNLKNNYMTKRNVSFGIAIPPAPPTPAEVKAMLKELRAIEQALKNKSADSDTFRGVASKLKTFTNKVGAKAGFRADFPTPRMAQTDAYYVAADFYAHKHGKDNSVSQIAFRREMLPWMKDLGIEKKDSKFVFHGLRQIMDEVLHNPITKQEIDEADKFYKTAKNGGEFKWNRKLWDKIVKENHGIIPIKVEAMPDGSTVFPGEPVMQISAGKGYGELTSWFETKLLAVWANSERASMLRHWLDYNKNLVKACTNENLSEKEVTARAQKMLVDFSDRSGMCPQESEWLGSGSILSFPTISTTSAAYRAYKMNGDKAASSLSMPSISHRIVEGYKHEGDAYKAMYNYTKGGPGSYVADCYDYRNAVKKYLVPLAIDAAKENKAKGLNTVVYARPDSGDAYDEVKFVLDEAVKAGLYKEVTARDGTKLKAMTTLRVVQADGMKFTTMMAINKRLIAEGFSPPDCLSYGVGGFLHDATSRSNMSAAQKLAEVGLGRNKRPVMKCPIGEPVKESIPGVVKVVREKGSKASTVRMLEEEGESAYVTWFDGIDGHGIENKEDFSEAQKRTLEEFDTYQRPENIFSKGILDLKQQFRDKHHNNVA